MNILNIATLIMVVAYGLISILIGFRSRNKETSKSSESFLLGGRSIGPIITIASLTMGILSGMAFYGTPALIMRSGNSCLVFYGFGITFFAYCWFGYRFWKLGRERHYLTAGDFMRDRYNSEFYRKLVALIQLLFMIPYITVQFVAVGSALAYFTGIPYWAACVVFGILLLTNFLVGGGKGVGMQDVFNVIIGLGVPIILCALAIHANGGMNNLAEMAIANDPTFLRPGNGQTISGMSLNVLTRFITGIFAVLFAPHVLTKVLMVKDRASLKKMVSYGPVFYLLAATCASVMFAWIGIALYKPAMEASNTTDLLVQTLTSEYGNTVLIVFSLFALMVFAMSTANAFMISCGAIVSADLISPTLRKNKNLSKADVDRICLRGSKIGAIIIVILTVLFSLTRNMYITDYAYSLSTPGFAQIIPAFLFGLFWKRPCKEAAIVSTLAGFITVLFCTFVVPEPLGIHQVIWSLGINLILFFLISFIKRPERKVVEDMFPLEQDLELKC